MKSTKALLLVAPIIASSVANAADQTWIDANTNNNWNTATDLNWDASAAWTQGNNAIFGGAGENVALATGINVGNITFNSGGYTISGNTLTLTSSTIDTGANNATISSTLAGTTGFTKTGSGNLTISTLPGAGLTGGIAINGGALTLGFLGGTVNNNITGAGTLNLTPTGGAFANFALSNLSGFTGTLNYGAGAFSNATAANHLPGATSNINVAAGGEILINNGLNYAGNITIAGNGIVGGGDPPGNVRAALHLYQATISGNITLAADARIGAGNAGAASTISGAIDTAGFVVNFNNNNVNNSSGAINVTGQIKSAGSVLVSNSAANGFTVNFSNANNNYSGGTTVASGKLVAGHVNAFGSGAINVTGGELALGNFSISNAITLNGGKLTGTNVSISNVTLGANSAVSGSYTGTFNTGTNAARTITSTGGATFQNLTGQATFSGGSVTVNGLHGPGNSSGTQTFASGLTYANSSSLNLEIASDGLTSDFINVTAGGMNIGTNVALTLALYGTADYTTAFWDLNHTYTLASVNAKTGDFASVNNLLGGTPDQGSWSFGWNNTNYQATWTAVPEPSVPLLCGLGVIVLLRRRRN